VWRLEPLRRSSWRRAGTRAVDAVMALQLAAILREYRADRKERSSQEAAKACRERLTLIGLFAAALFAGLNLRHLQFEAAEDRARFIATQRAWLSVDEVKIRPDSFFSEARGAQIGIAFRVKNKGHTPATKIEAGITNCEQIKCHALTGNPFAGNAFADHLRSSDTITQLALFQDDEFVVHRTLTIPPEKLRWVKQPGNHTEVWFELFVGVGYSIVGDSKRHVTAIPNGVLPFRIDADEFVFRSPYDLSPSQLVEPVVD
jgi:hypothetical protein